MESELKETKENPKRVYDIHTDTFHDDLTSAYAFAIDAGYQGSIEEFVEDCKKREQEEPQATVTKDGIIQKE